MVNTTTPPPKGKGRPPGAVNKATGNAREAIASFVEGNVERLNGWLDAIAEGVTDEDGKILRKPDPQAAFDCVMAVCEYHIPKLARTEQQFLDKDGKPADANVSVKYID